MVAVPVEGHEEDILTTSILMPVESAIGAASHPGFASGVHLASRVRENESLLSVQGHPNCTGAMTRQDQGLQRVPELGYGANTRDEHYAQPPTEA